MTFKKTQKHLAWSQARRKKSDSNFTYLSIFFWHHGLESCPQFWLTPLGFGVSCRWFFSHGEMGRSFWNSTVNGNKLCLEVMYCKSVFIVIYQDKPLTILSHNCRLKPFVSGECCRLQYPILSVVGSMEEKWYLEIMDKGSVSCPTCQAVGRKTIEGLKKHMENCKQVSYFVAFHDC